MNLSHTHKVVFWYSAFEGSTSSRHLYRGILALSADEALGHAW